MKSIKNILTLISFFLFIFEANAGNYTWNGSVNSSWTTLSNWSPTPSASPSSTDTVKFITGTNDLTLDANRSVYRLIVSSDTVNLAGYTLQTANSASFLGGYITNGTLDLRGSNATFSGTYVNVTVSAVCTTVLFNGSTFNQPVDAQISGTNASNGGNTFNSTLNIFNIGGGAVSFSNTSKDYYNGAVTVSDTLTRSITFATSDTAFFNNNIYINSRGTGITFGGSSAPAILASGKTISVGSKGFSSGSLVFSNFVQQGSTGQTMTLTSSAIINFISSTFNGDINYTAGGILAKNSTFNDAAIFTKTDAVTNVWYGGNTYNGKFRFTNTGSGSGSVQMQSSSGDTFADSVTINKGSMSFSGNYAGTSFFYNNLYTTGSNIDFYSGSGTYKFTGIANQILKGTAELKIGNLTMDKSSGSLTLQAPVLITSTLTLTSGIVITDTTNIISIDHGAISSGANVLSYISGPMKKIGNSAFIFATGKGGEYNPIGISAPSSSTNVFMAEYFSTGQALGDSTVDSLNFVYDCFYWSLRETTGSSSVKVTLYWDTIYCAMYNYSSLRVSSWDGSRWIDLSSDTIAGYEEAGYQRSGIAIVPNTKFTFAQEIVDIPSCNVYPGVDSNCKIELIGNGGFEEATNGPPPTYQLPSTYFLFGNALNLTTHGFSEVLCWYDEDCSHAYSYFVGGNTTNPTYCGSTFLWQFRYSIPYNTVTCAQSVYGSLLTVPIRPGGSGNCYIGSNTVPVGTSSCHVKTDLIIPLNSSKSYDLSMWVYLFPKYYNPISNNYTGTVNIEFTNTGGESYILPAQPTSYTAASPGWQQIQISFTPPVTSNPLDKMNIVTNSSSSNYNYTFIDDVSLLTDGPNSVFTYTGDPCIGSTSTTLDFEAITTLNSLSTTYVWNFDDGTTASSSNPSHTFTQPGFYQVSCTSNDGTCSSCYSQVIQIAPNCCYQGYTYEDNTIIPDVIKFDTYWTADYNINRTITVTDNATLTIGTTNTIYFGPFGKIVVDRGATLKLVDRPVLTSICHNMWLGIEVWGNSALGQTGSNQGKLIIGDLGVGASEPIIENAHNAVVLGKMQLQYDPCSPLSKKLWFAPAYSGGIIQNYSGSDYIHFESNGRGIYFTPYNYWEINSIQNHIFNLTDNTLLDPGYNLSNAPYVYNHIGNDHNPFFGNANDLQRTSEHIYLNGVRLSSINHCSFYFAQKGIYGYNTGFDVTSNSFDDHFIGIDLANGHSSPLFKHRITDNNFENIGNGLSYFCDGIRIKAGRSELLSLNIFGSGLGSQAPNFVGMRFENTYNYSVLDNTFTRLYRGVVCQNSTLGFANIIFISQGNLFDQCNIGIRSVLGNPLLRVRCNKFDNPTPGIFSSNWENGIAGSSPLPLTQGSYSSTDDKLPAGNEWDISLFTYKTITSPNDPYEYFHHDPGNFLSVVPNPTPGNPITNTLCPMVYKISTSCDPDITPHRDKRAGIDSLKTIINDFEDEKSELVYGLDDDLTDSLLNSIADSTLTSFALRTVLAPHAPLSDAVLLAYIGRDTVSADSDFVAIIIPNMPVSNDVISDLLTYLPSLSSASEDSVTFAQGYNPSYRSITAIDRDIENNTFLRAQYMNDVIIDFLDSSLVDSAISILEPEHDFKSDLALTSLYFTEERYEEAQELLNEMDYDDSEFEAWKQLFQLQLDLVGEERTVFELDSTEEAFIDSLANTGICELATMQAQAIMSMVYAIEYEPCDNEPLPRPGTNIDYNDGDVKQLPPSIESDALKVFPNPFSETCVVSYNISRENEKATIFLYNNMGALVRSIPLIKRKGIFHLSSDNLHAGIYLLSLCTDSKKTSVKVIIK